MEKPSGGKRRYNGEKLIIDRDEINLASRGLETDFKTFLDFIDTLGTEDTLSDGQWDKLFALLRICATADGRNWCAYCNGQNVLFDATTHEIRLASAEVVDSQKVDYIPESTASPMEKLKRYIEVLDRINEKMMYLQGRHRVYMDQKIKPVLKDLGMLDGKE